MMDGRNKRYEVFARSQRGSSLCHIGAVEAFSEELAKVYAHATYDEESWFELCIVPTESFSWVIRSREPNRKEGA